MKLSTWIKENLALVFAFTLPVLVIIVVAVSAYVPALFLSTDYDFIYVTCDDSTTYRPAYNCQDYLQQRYSVVGGQLSISEVDLAVSEEYPAVSDIDQYYEARIFLHNTEKNESREITLAEALTQNINPLITSPDGVTVVGDYDRNHGGDFFFFGGGSSGFAYYLTKGNLKSKINYITNGGDYYRNDDIKFIGWVPAAGR